MAWLIANAAVLGSALLALPYLIGEFWAYTVALYFLYAIACLGVGLSWGQAGLLSLGQGFFVGIGAYLSGLALINYSTSGLIYFLLPMCAALPGVLAYLLGRMIFHGKAQNGAFFALITLALVLLASQIATSWQSVTGGYNGLSGIPGIPGMEDFEDIYTLSAVALFFSAAGVGWLISSPLGVLWRALAQDERRVAFLGFDHNHLKALAFGFSGLLGGLAGALYAPENNLVTPDLFGFALSTNFVVWVAIGGRKTLYGPIFGAVVIGLMTATLRESISYWEVILAVIFIASVLYFREGCLGLIEPWLRSHFQTQKMTRKRAPLRTGTEGDGTLKLANVNLSAGSVNILNDLTLSTTTPGIYCLIGPNGAGKTTVFNALTGEMSPQSGSLTIMGQEKRKRVPNRLSKAGLGRKFQVPNVFDDLSIGENLAISLWTGRASRTDLLCFSPLNWTTPVLEELERRFDFLTDRNRMVRDLSHGQRQVLDIAMVLCTEAKILLLDEPCGGLSAQETKLVINTIRWAADKFGATAIIIEHDMTLVKELADHVFVLHNGNLLAEGTVEEIQQNQAVKSVYAGGTK